MFQTDNSRVGVLSLLLVAVQALSVPPLVGLWDFAGIAGYATGPVDAVPVYMSPSSSAAVVAHLDTSGISLAGGTRSCEWIRDLDVPTRPRGCVFTESDYEIPSLAAFERRDGWVRIALDNDATRFGWVRDSDQFHAIVDLLAGESRLTYLAPTWDGARRVAWFHAPGPQRTDRTHVWHYCPRERGSALQSHWPRRGPGAPLASCRNPRRGAATRSGDRHSMGTAQSPEGAQWAWFWSRGC